MIHKTSYVWVFLTYERVEDAEDLTIESLGWDMAVPYRGHYGDREQQGVGEGPRVIPPISSYYKITMTMTMKITMTMTIIMTMTLTMIMTMTMTMTMTMIITMTITMTMTMTMTMFLRLNFSIIIVVCCTISDELYEGLGVSLHPPVELWLVQRLLGLVPHPGSLVEGERVET